ncbi:CDP-diacylglycerol--glycerol-3-phosphate 3-phosphatidyltransferase [Clostridium aestuarii]|uniref:CDP-diacylglycerol--glycerol-3-phosphate 3-phosphatidyltransferase n=1 Tax=Clostridium aestuarii TaxID=338193 RepID=A0ABT4CY63_9CLOT|nr:CDP-diacylglycerol--glycerol-3-phosphate 3-phosphatidyltransferase [Clostridium aestuarii]MCY6483918.1 CDP-diacylglycerol--glycerol-3-phosphate 3-phosphatidyltransferase [Clostridium aestuarii]
MNLANKLTMIRIILVPVFLAFMVVNKPSTIIIATIIFILASITDKLDGYIARKRNEITKFGKFMDPLADKLLVTSALISLVEYGIIPAWVSMIIIGREFAVTGLRTIAASEGIIIAASWWGKIKTVTQMSAIICGLITLVYNYIFIKYATYVILTAAVIITIISGVDYFVKNKKALVTQN